MRSVTLRCTSCKKKFVRTQTRIAEAEKFGWNPYCSFVCEGEALSKQKIFLCTRPDCGVSFSRAPHEVRSNALYCSRRCAVIINNTKTPKRKALIRQCAYCENSFKGNRTYCSVPCKTKDQFLSKELISEKIKDFYRVHARIPLKREFLSYSAARDRFGTWNNAIKAAGFKPNPVLFSEKHLANDGHHCDSFAERIVDDFLYAKGISHKRNIPYPTSKRLTVDFVAGKRWIEFFGLAGASKEYDQLIRRKKSLAKKLHLRLIELYPKHLFPKNRLAEVIQV